MEANSGILMSASQFIPVAFAHPVGDVAPMLIDHPLKERIVQEVAALNHWISLNRSWTLVSLKYTLQKKLPIIANTEHYSQAALAANALFIDVIRFVFLSWFRSSLL